MPIEFPAIDPVALSLGPLQIRWYALAYLAGFIGAWQYCMRLADRCVAVDKNARPTRLDIDDFLPWAVIGVILGGRLGYVLFYNLDFYLQNPSGILQIWRGGMSFHGGVIGMVGAFIAFSKLRNVPLLKLSDIACAGIPIGLFFGRIANFINAELYGRVTDAPWGVVFPNGGDLPRHPSQLYEALLEGAVLFGVLFVLIRMTTIRAASGFVTGAFLFGYGIFRAAVELVREPDAHIGFIFGSLSMGQLLSAPMIIGGAGLMIWAWAKRTRAA